MATRHHKSRSRPSRNPVTRAAPAGAMQSAAALEDHIEEERGRLMKAHSILRCIVIAMESEEDMSQNGPYWPAVVELASDLIDEAIRRLADLDDFAQLQHPRADEVREPVMFYGIAPASPPMLRPH